MAGVVSSIGQSSGVNDQRRRDLVHPPNWVNPVPSSRYNLVVIGGGTAGLVTAAGAAGLGAKVALVEKHFLGGDCLNTGCVPSKALIRSARAMAEVRDAGRFGVCFSGEVSIDFAAVMERMRRLRADMARHDSAERFKDLGVDVFLGEGRFIGGDRIVVGDSTLQYAKAVIATGARATIPPIPGLQGIPWLTNETLFELAELPRRMAIIGAGPIGCEMAQCFARFGTEVVLLGKGDDVLPREDRDAAELVLKSMKHDGVRWVPSVKDLRVSGGAGGIRVQGESSSQPLDVTVDRLLLASGRSPNVHGLGLDKAGVRFDDRGVTVDDHLRTTNPDIYACGDVCSAWRFTHAADFMARTVLQNALFHGRARFSDLLIPRATYTSPEIAQVGLSSQEAVEKGIAVDAFQVPLDQVDRAILDGETEGFVRVLVRSGTDQIVGALCVSAHAGEMISELTLAMKSGTGLKTIANVIHPYPTQADAIRKTGDLYNKTRLTPLVRSLFQKWLAWQRR